MEQWTDIAGYEGEYQVSNQGQVRSLEWLLPMAVLEGVRREKKVLKPSANAQGRWGVTLCSKDPDSLLRGRGIHKRFQVHLLVLESFIGMCPEGLACVHLDEDVNNNKLDNLAWGKQQVKNYTVKLTEKGVLEIRADGGHQQTLAERYGVSQVTISHILKRNTWKHL